MASEQHDIEAKYTAPAPPPVVATPTIANPGPLGLAAFALTTFVLSLHNAGAGVSASGPSSVVVGLAAFYGGLTQLLAGMWEFRTGNTFGATAFSSYGGFWMAYAAVNIPGFGIKAAYADHPGLFERSMGYFLLGWTIFTGIMLIACHRSSVGLVALFFFLTVTFILLTAADIQENVDVKRAGGAFGVVTAIIAWYNCLAGLLTKNSSHFTLPVGNLP